MAKAIELLENDDVITGDELVRNIRFYSDISAHVSDGFSMSCFTARWTPIKRVFGPVWRGQTVGEINEDPDRTLWEFARGVPPEYQTPYAPNETEQFMLDLWEDRERGKE